MASRRARWTTAVWLVAMWAAAPGAQTIRPMPRPSPPDGGRGTPPAPAAAAPAYSGSIVDATLRIPAADPQTAVKELDRYRVVLAVLTGSPESLRPLIATRGPRFIVGPVLFAARNTAAPPTDALRREFQAGRLDVLEIAAARAGITLNDRQLEPYWALAESLDVPVGVTTGPRQTRGGSPLALKDVMTKHPRLRVWVMQTADPWRDDTFAAMAASPQVFTDVGGMAASADAEGRAAFEMFLKDAFARGYQNRIMFSSGESTPPQTIGEAVRGVDVLPFLTAAQKRDIFYANAKRFFRFADPS